MFLQFCLYTWGSKMLVLITAVFEKMIIMAIRPHKTYTLTLNRYYRMTKYTLVTKVYFFQLRENGIGKNKNSVFLPHVLRGFYV